MGPGIDAGQWFFFHSNVQLDTNEKTTIYSEPDNGESSNAAQGRLDERDQRAPASGRC